MIAGLEDVVLGAHAMYVRAYAWLKLVTIWSVVRGEDSTWLEEESLTFISGWVLRGKLAKSKTTGLGKKTRHREIFVSSEAYAKRPEWLESVWRLWDVAPKPRQNFIALPDPSLEAFRQVGAEVQDRVA